MIERMSSTAAPAPSTVVPARESLDPKYTWDLSSIFPELGRLGSGVRRARPGHRGLQDYEGTLAQGARAIVARA